MVHPLKKTSGSARKLCKFDLQGRCKLGANCPYRHVAVEESDVPSTYTSNKRKQKKKKKHDDEENNGAYNNAQADIDAATGTNGPPPQHEPYDPASSDTPRADMKKSAKTKKSKSKKDHHHNRKSKDAATETEAAEGQFPTRLEISATLSALRNHAAKTQSNLSEMNDIMIMFGAKYVETQSAVNDLQAEISGLEAKLNQDQQNGPTVVIAESNGERKQSRDVPDTNAVMSTPAWACATTSSAPPPPKSAHSTNGASAVAAPNASTSVDTSINIKPMNIDQKAPPPRSTENQTVIGGAAKHSADSQPKTLRAKPSLPPVPPTRQEAATATSVQRPKSPPPTNELEEIIRGHSTYIIGSPKDYVSDLRNELDIETAKNFAEALGEGLEAIANMSSGRATGHDVDFCNKLFGKVAKDQRQFCEQLLAAILCRQSSVEADTGPHAGHIPGVSSSIANAERTITVRTMFQANAAKKIGLVASNPRRLVSQDDDETVERQKRRQEEASAKAAQMARTKAEKTQRREPARQEEKPEGFMMPVNVCVEVDLGGSKGSKGSAQQPKTTTNNSKLDEAVPIPTSESSTKASTDGASSGAEKKSDSQDSKPSVSLSLSSIRRRDKSKPFEAASKPESADPPPSGYKESISSLAGAALSNKSKRKLNKGHKPRLRRSPHVSTERLSTFIHSYPDSTAASGNGVSEIFRLLQDVSTLKSARELLRLEQEVKECKQDILETEKKIEGLNNGIALNKRQLMSWQAEREEAQKRIKKVYQVDLSDTSHANVEKILRDM